MNALILALSLSFGVPRPTVVLVLQEETPESCFLTERVAAAIEVTPSLRLIRDARARDETLETARARLGATVAIGGGRERGQNAAAASVVIQLAREGHPLESKSVSPSVPVPTHPEAAQHAAVDNLLRAVWPSDLPPLASSALPAAANVAALEAACRLDARAAYEASGAAIGRTVRARVLPTEPSLKTLALRHARASGLVRGGQTKEAIPLLKGVVSSLSRGEMLATWRRAPRDGAIASTIEPFGDLFIAFESGRFVALDASTGVERWSLEGGRATPFLSDAGGGLALASLTDEIAAIELGQGRVLWRAPLHAPAPELAVLGGRLFVAGQTEILAVDRAKGDILWRHDPLVDLISGPILSGKNLVVGAEASILLLDPESGTVKKKLDLGDEISAPLIAGDAGRVWAMVGGDQIFLVDPEMGEIKLKAKDLGGSEWPPVPLADRLIVSQKRRDGRRAIVYLDASAKNGIGRIQPNAAAPIATLSVTASLVHVEERPPAILARNIEGGALFRVAVPARVADLRVASDVIAAAVGTRVLVLEPKKGSVSAELDLGESVQRVAYGPRGGAAVVESGAVYGFLAIDDARQRTWLRDARIELARCHLDQRENASAATVARQMLERDPADVEALEILATAQTNARSKDAVELWLEVARLVGRGEPAGAKAAKALSTLAGIEAFWAPERPIRALAVTEPGVVQLETEAGVELRAFDSTLAVRGRRPGARIERKPELYRVTDARPRVLVREGRPGWTKPLEDPELRLGASAPDYVALFGPSDEGNIAVHRAATGERTFSRPVHERVVGAAIVADRLLIVGEKHALGIAAESGDGLFEVKIPEGGTRPPVAAEGILVVASKNKLRLIEPEKGRVRAEISLPAEVREIVPAARAISVALTDGTVLAIELDKGTIAGRETLGRMLQLFEADGKILGLTESGELFILDPSRKLRP